MKLLLLLPLIATIAVNGLSTKKFPNGHQDYDYEHGIPESGDEHLQRKEMNLFDGNEDSIDETEPLHTPSDRQGSQMRIFEDDKEHIEIELQNGPITTAQSSWDCESNGGECKKNIHCNDTISIEYTCRTNEVCCIVEGKALNVCNDISSICAHSAFQCETSTYVQGRCRKTCGLCGGTDGVSELTMLSNAILNQGMAIQKLKEDQENVLKNQDIIISNLTRIGDLEIKLHTMESNINNLTTMMKYDNANFTQKLDYIISQQDVECPSDWHSVNGDCFYLSNEPKIWTDAKTSCEAKGASLAQPTTATEVQALIGLLQQHSTLTRGPGSTFWVGGLNQGTSTYNWLNGNEVIAGWMPGEPKRTAEGVCVGLYMEGNVGLGVWTCKITLRFICQSSATPNTISSTTTTTMITANTPGCPSENGFFMFADRQCFKIYKDQKIYWSSAKTLCESNNLQLAEPLDASAADLRKHLIDNKGQGVWVGAKSSSSGSWSWNSGGSLSSSSPLFYSHPRSNACLALLVMESYWKEKPSKPYHGWACKNKFFTLCQVRP